MPKGQGHNMKAGGPRFGPRHSSPQFLQNSPGSPNIAPIPVAAATQGPQLRLFTPAVTVPVPGLPVAWGSGAFIQVVPPTVPSNNDTQDPASECQGKQKHSRKTDKHGKDSKKHRHGHRKEGHKSHSKEGHHGDRKESHRSHSKEEVGHHGERKEGHRAHSKVGHRGDRNEGRRSHSKESHHSGRKGHISHSIGGSEEFGHHGDMREISDGHKERDSYNGSKDRESGESAHSHRGEVLLEDRGVDNQDNQWEKRSEKSEGELSEDIYSGGESVRSYRQEDDRQSLDSQYRGQREGRQYSGGESVRSSRWEDDRESLDSHHRRRNTRHEREHRAVLIDDRDEDRPRHGGARLIEDFVDPTDRLSDRDYGQRGGRGSDRESRGLDWEGHRDNRDLREERNYRRSREKDMDQQWDTRYSRDDRQIERETDRERNRVKDRGRDYEDINRDAKRQYSEYSDDRDRERDRNRSEDFRDYDRGQGDKLVRDDRDRNRDQRLDDFRDHERGHGDRSARDDRDRKWDQRLDDFKDHERGQGDRSARDDRDRNKDQRSENYRDHKRGQGDSTARDDRDRNRDQRPDNFRESEKGQGDRPARDDRDRNRDQRLDNFRESEKGQGDRPARDDRDRNRDQRLDNFRESERGQGDRPARDDRDRNRDQRSENYRDHDWGQGDRSTRDDRNRMRDHRLDDFKDRERGQADRPARDARDRNRDQRSQDFQDHDRGQGNRPVRDERDRNRDQRLDNFRDHERDRGDRSVGDVRDRKRDQRPEEFRDRERGDGSWSARDDRDRNRDHRSEEFRDCDRGQEERSVRDERDRNRNQRLEDFRDHERERGDRPARDDRDRKRDLWSKDLSDLEQGQGDRSARDGRDVDRGHRTAAFRDRERGQEDRITRDDRGRTKDYSSEDYRDRERGHDDWAVRDDMDRNRGHRSDNFRNRERVEDDWSVRDEKIRDLRSEEFRDRDRDHRDRTLRDERDIDRGYRTDDYRESDRDQRDWTSRDERDRNDVRYRDDRSERSISQDRSRDSIQRGRTGAVLREDRDDSRPILPERTKDVGRTGALLIEDREPDDDDDDTLCEMPILPERTQDVGRTGALLIEDRGPDIDIQGPRHEMPILPERTQDVGRTGALLIEDRGPDIDIQGPRHEIPKRTADVGRTGALLIEDRIPDVDILGPRHEIPSLPERIKDVGRTGAVLIEDREADVDTLGPRRERPIVPERTKDVGRTGALLIEDRGPDIDTLGPHREIPVLLERMKDVGRTGALLIEDRDPEFDIHGPRHEIPVLPERNQDIGRRGAVLREDRVPDCNTLGPLGQRRGPARIFDHRGHGGNSRDRAHGMLEEKSQERSLRGQGHKRPWCSSQDQWREDSMLSDRDSIGEEPYNEMGCWLPNDHQDPWGDHESEPEYKRRRLQEAAEENKIKCIRSGSPALVGTEAEQLPAWVRSSAADLYFTKDYKTGNLKTTKRMQDLENKFDYELVQRNARMRAAQAPYELPKRPEPKWHHHHNCQGGSDDHHKDNCLSSSSSSEDSDSDVDQEEQWLEELRHKEQHPYRLHKELWHNEKGELNYGPLCKCSMKARKSGIRHDKYPGEEPVPQCDMKSNNLNKLYHYKITVSPVTNFLTNNPSIIMFDGHEYIFEGFSIFTHKKLPKLPECQLIRFYIVYTIHIIEEPPPENFSVRSLDLFSQFLFEEILELVDIDWKGPGGDGDCRRFHVMPRFARPFPENGKEILSMNDVLLYLLKSSKPLVAPRELSEMLTLEHQVWQKYVDGFRYMIVTCPGKKPSSLRIDQLDKQDCAAGEGPAYPLIIHHGLRPAQLSYAGDPIYKKKWREYMKFRHLLWSRTKVSARDKEKLEEFENELQQIRSKCTMKREITVEISCEGFLLTGIRADICQHAMLLPILFGHIRFHDCLSVLERTVGYEFKDKSLLQLALTHSSYKVNHGTNPDHGRNSLSNCGSRQLEFGDHKIHIKNTRKRGLNILLRVMSKMAKKSEEKSDIPHNERLEYLGDAVVEFISSVHLFYMFPHADEGELTNYRGSLVQNAQLAVLANKLKLQDFLLYAHGPDLCHARDLRHAMANCFEAVMGALFLDGGIELADRVFSYALFDDDPKLLDTWIQVPKHPLQEDEPKGDRHWIKNSPTLQKLLVFENDIGYEYRHIRLLAKAFTQRNIGYNHLTMGHNQRLEFLGDTIMKLISSDYLFRHFPDHHEGHLTLLRSSLVNNRTQSTVAEELGMPEYVINMQKETKPDMVLKQKEKADLLEAYLGSLYVDGGLDPCYALCNVCFFPRLEDFILTQEWNDPKSQLQQCCLTLRDMNDESPDIPVYKVLSKSGPTNSRIYKVGVYFRGKRLAIGQGNSKQLGEMKAAENALKHTKGLFHNRFWSLDKLRSADKKSVEKNPGRSHEKEVQGYEQAS